MELGDIFLLGVVVALAAWGVAALRAFFRGEVVPKTCPWCGRIVSRADKVCRHCKRGLV